MDESHYENAGNAYCRCDARSWLVGRGAAAQSEQYLILAKGHGFSDGFEAAVQAAGGVVDRKLSAIGVAVARSEDPGFHRTRARRSPKSRQSSRTRRCPWSMPWTRVRSRRSRRKSLGKVPTRSDGVPVASRPLARTRLSARGHRPGSPCRGDGRQHHDRAPGSRGEPQPRLECVLRARGDRGVRPRRHLGELQSCHARRRDHRRGR